MVYRTKTYLAGDWTGDKDLIKRIREWNESDFYSLFHFIDVHDLVQARDTSLPCTIKESLRERMKMCKTFVLVVGLQTSSLRSGSCQFCKRYVNSTYSFTGKSHCYSGGVIDTRSYVEFECEQAVKQGLKIIVLYNFFLVNKRFCPKSIENKGTHVAIRCIKNGKYDWDYGAVRDAFLK